MSPIHTPHQAYTKTTAKGDKLVKHPDRRHRGDDVEYSSGTEARRYNFAATEVATLLQSAGS